MLSEQVQKPSNMVATAIEPVSSPLLLCDCTSTSIRIAREFLCNRVGFRVNQETQEHGNVRIQGGGEVEIPDYLLKNEDEWHYHKLTRQITFLGMETFTLLYCILLPHPQSGEIKPRYTDPGTWIHDIP